MQPLFSKQQISYLPIGYQFLKPMLDASANAATDTSTQNHTKTPNHTLEFYNTNHFAFHPFNKIISKIINLDTL
jgi:hypothetical protein